jgi:hypothetical protein
MIGRRVIDPWRREIIHSLGSSIFALFLLISDYASAAIYINRESKVLLLSGYSSDLTKRELPGTNDQGERPAINERLEFLLRGLSEGLEEMFDASIEHLSERDLNARLDLQGLPKRSPRGSPGAIRELLEVGKYTHLLVADVQMKTENSGSAWMQIARLSSDGSTIESAATQKITLRATQNDGELNNLRQVILRNFARFRPPDAPKRITVLCILPRNRVVGEFTEQLQLERILSEPITTQIIEIHHRQKMQEMGYKPIVHRRSWEFKKLDNDGREITCEAGSPVMDSDGVVINVQTKLTDYIIEGKVGVISIPVGFDKVDLRIDVIRRLPTYCQTEQIQIPYRFERNRYQGNGKVDLSWEFSQTILPAQYEQKWLASLDTCK